MIELLSFAWTIFLGAIVFALACLVIVAGVAVVFGPVFWLIWWLQKDEDRAKFVNRHKPKEETNANP